MMESLVKYCSGCNELYQVSPDEAFCPNCAQDLISAETVSTIEDEFRDRQIYNKPEVEVLDFSKKLIGRDLSTYTIDAFAGRGGMAWVFRATHKELHRPCAVKVLCPSLVEQNDAVIEQFFAEARAAASLVHPNIVTVHNICHADNFHLIELEFVDGKSLQKIVKAKGRLAPLQATELMVQMLRALQAAHSRGMIHRDFKPANILVADSGIAKLADFGLAKSLLAKKKDAQKARLSGTPYFMAPELFDGIDASKQSDIYAVGAAYYQLLTGQVPFKDLKLQGLIDKHAQSPIPDPRTLVPDIPNETVEIVNRCLAKNPNDRYGDATEAHEAFRQVLGKMKSLRTLVEEAFHGTSIEWTEANDRFTARLQQPDDRAQCVHIEAASGGLDAAGLVRIFSVCSPEDESYYRRALELNSEIAHGSLAIEEVDGKPHFVMLNAYPRSTCDPDEIRHSVITIAKWADEVERSLQAHDVH